MKYPVIYTLEPIGVDGANEATGVHWYCSTECRAEDNPVDSAFDYGMAELDTDNLKCESCYVTLEGAIRGA